MTFFRKLSSAVAVASLFAAAPALAGNRDGFDAQPEPERTAQAAKHDCASCPSMARGEGSAGEVGKPKDAEQERSAARSFEADPFNREMDAGG